MNYSLSHRHWATVGFLIMVMTLLVGVITVVLCAPVCKSPTVVVVYDRMFAVSYLLFLKISHLGCSE